MQWCNGLIRLMATVLIIKKPFKGEPLLAGFLSTTTHYNSFYTVREKPNTRGSAGWIQDVWSYSCKYIFSQTKSSIVFHSDIGPPSDQSVIQQHHGFSFFIYANCVYFVIVATEFFTNWNAIEGLGRGGLVRIYCIECHEGNLISII